MQFGTEYKHKINEFWFSWKLAQGKTYFTWGSKINIVGIFNILSSLESIGIGVQVSLRKLCFSRKPAQ